MGAYEQECKVYQTKGLKVTLVLMDGQFGAMTIDVDMALNNVTDGGHVLEV